MELTRKGWAQLVSVLVTSYFAVQFLSFWWEIFCMVAKSMINGFVLDTKPS